MLPLLSGRYHGLDSHLINRHSPRVDRLEEHRSRNQPNPPFQNCDGFSATGVELPLDEDIL